MGDPLNEESRSAEEREGRHMGELRGQPLGARCVQMVSVDKFAFSSRFAHMWENRACTSSAKREGETAEKGGGGLADGTAGRPD